MIHSRNSKFGDFVVVAICILLILACFLPILNVLARSISSPMALVRREVFLWPKGLDFTAYSLVLKDAKYTWALGWTAILTILCTLLSMTMTTLCAYPLIFRQLKGRKLINGLILLTMYFNAGTIPNFILFKNLGMINQPSVLIIPYCLSVFNMIIMRTFLQNIPESLRESAELDGAGPIQILISIYLPLSTSVIATLSLFYAVGRWNGYSDALMFMNSNKPYYPIQLLLYYIIQSKVSVDAATQEGFTTPGASESIKAATVMIATIPILLIYPWLQRYFIHGVTLGAMKG
jgi:putative aldouronate transport system permease protein